VSPIAVVAPIPPAEDSHAQRRTIDVWVLPACRRNDTVALNRTGAFRHHDLLSKEEWHNVTFQFAHPFPLSTSVWGCRLTSIKGEAGVRVELTAQEMQAPVPEPLGIKLPGQIRPHTAAMARISSSTHQIKEPDQHGRRTRPN
jgi:hypothetical protein